MKKIPLTPEGYALVDDADFIELSKWAWHRETRGSGGLYYARRGSYYYGKVKKPKAMHRYLMDASKGEIVDHINGDTLDNRRSNLRICTVKQNAYNRAKYKNNSSGVKGVHRHKNYWRARIQYNGKRLHIGLYEKLEDAMSAYDQMATKLYGEFKR